MRVAPRPYQKEIFELTKAALRQHRSVCVEAPTGAGKSVILSMIVHAVDTKNRRRATDNAVYIVVDKTHLLMQMSGHLDKWRIPHGVITGGKYERPGVRYHVCTIQTLRNRPPKRDPALLIFDEAHHMSPSVIELSRQFPNSKIIGVTASPERLSGRGLATKSDPAGIYDELIESPVSMRELTEKGYLAKIDYYAPPVQGLDTLKVVAGEYKTGDVEELIKRRGIYGDAIDHYRKIAPGTKCLVFCRSVAGCHEFADSLNSHGFRAAPLEGGMGARARAKVLRMFKTGELTHLTTCKLVLEGFDLPAIESILDLAPTCSRALWRQKLGRLTRPYPGKEKGIYIDPVGGVITHTSAGDIYEEFDWRFWGSEYNKPEQKSEAADRYCSICYGYIPPPGRRCQNCGAEKKKSETKKEPERIDGDLKKVEPVPLSERWGGDRKEIQDAILLAVVDLDIERLRVIGETLTSARRLPFWIYHQIKGNHKIIDVPLLYKIQRSFEYKKGWVYYAREQLKGRRD